MGAQDTRTGANERFRGLSTSQIQTLLVIDERAEHATSIDNVSEVVLAYQDADIPFTADDALRYAQGAEAAGMHGVAYPWYSWWTTYEVRSDDELARRKAEFKAYFIRHGFLWNLREHRCTCSEDEWRTAANAALAERHLFGSLGTGAAREVLSVFTRIKDRRGIRAFLTRALRAADEDDAFAVAAAAALGRELTTNERVRLARRLLRNSTNLSDACTYIRKHRLRTLYRPLITAAVASEWVPFEDALTWSSDLRTPLRRADLERGFRVRSRRGTTRIDDAVTFAEALAQRSDAARWRVRMPKIYAWARDGFVGWCDVQRAERYGKRCGKPLTHPELMRIAEHLQSRIVSNGGHLDWAEKDREYCLQLAAKRIAATFGTSPTRPRGREAAAV